MKTNRINNEVAHGEKLGSNAEEIWGWSSAAGQVRANRRAAYFRDLTTANAGKGGNLKLLEIGCGTGLFTEKMGKIGGGGTNNRHRHFAGAFGASATKDAGCYIQSGRRYEIIF